jgi:hypothetical protein
MWPIFTPQMQAHFSSCSLDAISARLGAACLDDDLDLGIALSSDRETLIRGDIAHVQLHAENHDLHNFAHGVRAAFQLPASLGSTALPPDCSERQGLIDCALGDLAPHSGVLMELNLHAVAVGTADVAAFLSADGVYDFNGSDNSQQLRLTVLDAPIADDDGGGGGALHWITLGGLWLALRRPDPRSRR